ncbi:MAG TPA: PAS domain S-box protein [Chryseolinea sp.]
MMVKQGHSNGLSETTFRALIENAHDGIVLYDFNGNIKFASSSVKKLGGYRDSELIGRSGLEFIHPEDLENARKLFIELLDKPGESVTVFQRLRHKKGHFFWSEALLTNFLHVPEINGIVSNFRDISEKKLAEENARQTKELLETINRNLEEGIFMGILGTKFLYVNDAFLKITGYRNMEELMKIKPAQLYADDEHRKEIVEQLRRTSVLKGVETLFKKKNGKTFWGVVNVSLLKHEGKDEHFVGTIRDITRERGIELELLESRNFLRNIIGTVAAPMFVKDAKHRWVMMNQRFCGLIGFSEKMLIGKTDKDFLNEDEAKIFWNVDNHVLKTGKTIFNEEKITSKEGHVYDLLTVKSRYVNEKGEKFVIGFITDVTRIKKVEETIKELNATLRGVMESTNESIYAVDTSFRYLMFNQNHKKIMKDLYRADIKVGDYKLGYLKNSGDLKWVKAEIRKAMNGDVFVSEHYIEYPKYAGYIQTTFNPIRDESNKIKGVAVFVKDVTERKRFEEIIQSINANLKAVLESTADRILAIDRNYRYIMFNQSHANSVKKLFDKDIRPGDSILKILPPELASVAKTEGRKVLKGEQFSSTIQLRNKSILEASFNPIHDEQKKIIGAAIFVRDITERKKIEEKLKALNEELVSQNVQMAAQEEELKATLEELSERNFELDQLMYKTSHDLRSPLSSIMGLVNLANLDKDTASRDSYLSKISGRIKKLDDFIRSMLDYARVNRVEVVPEAIDLKGVASGCIRELEHLDNFDNIKTEISSNGTNTFKSDPLRIKVIFGNIISNAYKYFNSSTQSFLKIKIDIKEDKAKIEFKDNGIGIRDEHLDKIFNMFYRATERSQGSGLGMYIVKQAVEKLDGNITINSKFGEGTEIKVVLPNHPPQ